MIRFCQKLGIISFLSLIFLTLTANFAQAVRWLYIGSGGGFEYYVDVDGEAVQGSYWTAPLRAESSNGTFIGQVLVDCSDYTFKTQVGNQVSGWQRIEAGSPLSTVVNQVCP